MMLSPRRDSYQRFPTVSRRANLNNNNNNNNSLFKCTQTRAIVSIIFAWIILTFITYQKIYNVDSTRLSRKKGAIPQHHGEALNLYKHLEQKIKAQEEKLKEAGIDISDLHLLEKIENFKGDVNKISDPLQLFESLKGKLSTSSSSSSSSTSTTKKPTQSPTNKPTEKEKTDKYYDTDEEDTTLHNLDWIRDRMYYWKKGIAKHEGKPLKKESRTGKYLTFWSDCGGFNNIRMGFEYMLIVGYLTNRTVVLPPIEGWYLIDWGRRARMNSMDSSGKSGYPEFFDFDHLNMEVDTCTTEEFIQAMSSQLSIDSKFGANGYFDGGMRDWRKYLNKKADDMDTNMAWGPLAHILNWPSIAAVEGSAHKPDRMFISNRDNIEYTEREQNLAWIHFPSCDKGDPGTSRDYRYLGQVASFVWFDTRERSDDLMRMMRDHIHLREEVMFYASYIVQKLGAFQYAALHIRRNELQYKESFIEAQDSLKHIKPLLKPNEILYIATDEKDSKFFEAIEKEYTVYKWKDFVEPGGKMYLGDDIKMPRKYEGVIEMAVCGMGRIFFGTDTSTFTSYITRLRGYFDAPDTSTYHHNEQWSGDLHKDSMKHHKQWGQTYMDEFPEMWENIKGSY